VLLPVSLGAATGITRVVAVAAFACPPAHRDSTGRGNTSNGPPQPSPKKKKHRRSLRKHVAFVAVRLPVLLPLLAVRLLLRSCGVSLCGCRCCRCRAASRSPARRCVALLRTQPLLPVVLPAPAAPGAAAAPALLLLVVGAGRTAPVKPTAIVVNDNTLFRVAP
jgi:hypothetical protein